MKIKIKILIIVFICTLNGCALITNQNKKEVDINSFVYATKCIDIQKKKVHFFKTYSPTPLSKKSISNKVAKKGYYLKIKTNIMNCNQISLNQIDI